MRGAQVPVRAAVELDQAVEHGVTGQAAALQVFHVHIPLAIGLAVAHGKVRLRQRNCGQAPQAVTRAVQALIEPSSSSAGVWRVADPHRCATPSNL